MTEALEEEKEERKQRKPLSVSTLMPISQERWMV